MKYYIIAGEASGDLHGANLMKEIFAVDAEAEIRFWGGDLMQKVGGTLVMHYKKLAFMGFAEVVSNLKTILNNLSFCKTDIENFKPDTIIFVDYPGFNLRIAKWAKKKNYSTQYYISPQIWAWKENRINAIKRDVDHMYVILPFEQDFYEGKHNYKVEFVGHPLLDAVEQFKLKGDDDFLQKYNLGQRRIIALLPGSRRQEISKLLDVMLSVCDDFADYDFVIAGAPSQDESFYLEFIKTKNVHLVLNQTYELLSHATAALVTSGTATLETALFKVPEVVCYKGGWISYQIAKRILTLKYISLVNLIMNKMVVTELIQDDCNTKNIKIELSKLLENDTRNRMLSAYNLLAEKLGGGGASKKTASLIVRNAL